jgi:exopolysaccharide biosynthesis polyprenyl glycosylphosphotransferase
LATPSAEIRETEATLNGAVSAAKSAARAEWLSNLLKNTAATRALSLFADALALAVAHRAAVVLVVRLLGIPGMNLNPPNYALFYLPFLLAVLFLFERNQRPELRRPEKELELAVKGVSLAFLLLVCANFVLFRAGISRYMMVSWYFFALLALLVERHCLRMGYGWLWSHEIGRRRTLLVGSEGKLFELQTLLSIQRYRGYELLGIVPVEGDSQRNIESRGLPILGTLDQWQEAAREARAEQVIVALEESSPAFHGLVSQILKCCLADGIDVQVYSDLFASRAFNYELDEFSGFFRFFAARRWSSQVQIAAKKALDLAAGVVGSLITLLVLPIIALMIKLEDGGPIFYRSEFLDCQGNLSSYPKFRSMHTNAREILDRDRVMSAKFAEKQKLANDPRVTCVGRVLRKFSIDELPEFFSVLSGQLSLVGPRTICRQESARYGNCLSKLLTAKPGLTGFWQVMGRQLTTYQERVQMDMFYIDHWSIWLDLWIVVKTFWKVLRAEGAY